MPWAPDYITVEDLAAYCKADEVADAADLALAVTGASRAIDRNTNRQFGLAAATELRYYTARWSKSRGAWVVPIDDLMSGAIVKVDADGDGVYTDEITLFDLLPRNAAARGRPWEQLVVRPKSTVQPDGCRDGVELFAQPGWTAVPDTIELACRLQASRFFTRREAPFGIAGSPAEGSEMRLLAKVDPDVAVALDDYRRKVWTR